MISYWLEGPTSWSATIATATAGWPPVLARWSRPDRPAERDGSPAGSAGAGTSMDVAQVRGWLRDEALTGLPIPTSSRSVSSMVIGRRPMTADRISSWMRRTATPLGLAADRDVLRTWDLGETLHRFTLPCGPEAPRLARSTLRAIAGDTQPVDDILLVVSELSANAVQHGRGPVELRVHSAADTIVIELADSDARSAPEVRRTPIYSVAGRGMSIVDTLAAHWGVTVGMEWKTVWCEFRL